MAVSCAMAQVELKQLNPNAAAIGKTRLAVRPIVDHS